MSFFKTIFGSGDENKLPSIKFGRYTDDEVKIESGLSLFKNLFTKGDYYDNVLIEQYACQALNKEWGDFTIWK